VNLTLIQKREPICPDQVAAVTGLCANSPQTPPSIVLMRLRRLQCVKRIGPRRAACRDVSGADHHRNQDESDSRKRPTKTALRTASEGLIQTLADAHYTLRAGYELPQVQD